MTTILEAGPLPKVSLKSVIGNYKFVVDQIRPISCLEDEALDANSAEDSTVVHDPCTDSSSQPWFTMADSTMFIRHYPRLTSRAASVAQHTWSALVAILSLPPVPESLETEEDGLVIYTPLNFTIPGYVPWEWRSYSFEDTGGIPYPEPLLPNFWRNIDTSTRDLERREYSWQRERPDEENPAEPYSDEGFWDA
ncbi:hypothetical protein BT63DRAFT_475847 [Microthyrium microscopicum]|uniref:Uncharacterized protein n=1 Tax=Microthyrium microscopicum TaxID=703497 RepID=A0A6A6UM07_9PEZI|nr:hypothetical protein BT63DRAFT_475847 [Microthyrium microscopicum]